MGLRPDDAAVGEVFERALAGARAFGDSSYKAKLAVGAARRALRMAAGEQR